MIKVLQVLEGSTALYSEIHVTASDHVSDNVLMYMIYSEIHVTTNDHVFYYVHDVRRAGPARGSRSSLPTFASHSGEGAGPGPPARRYGPQQLGEVVGESGGSRRC